MKDINLQIKHNLRAYRKLHGLTQEQVAEAIGIEPQYYSTTENANNLEKNLPLPRLMSICELYKITLNDLAGFEEKEESFDAFKEIWISDICSELGKMDAKMIGLIRLAIKSLNE